MAGDNQTTPAIILVRPQLGENIGAAARVMANFGLSDLRLVAPRDHWPNPAAEPLSAGALDGPVTVSVHRTTAEAVGGLLQVGAATARGRELITPVIGPGEFAHLCLDIAAKPAVSGAAGILFGQENSGLSNDDVALADFIVTYPVNSAFPSLNLAQAVGVFCFAWRSALAGDAPRPRDTSAQSPVHHPPATKDEIIGLQDHLIAALDRAGFFFPPEKADGMRRNLRTMLARPGFTVQEVQTLRGAIKAIENGPRRRARELMQAQSEFKKDES